jgi:hypothetical protein
MPKLKKYEVKVTQSQYATIIIEAENKKDAEYDAINAVMEDAGLLTNEPEFKCVVKEKKPYKQPVWRSQQEKGRHEEAGS